MGEQYSSLGLTKALYACSLICGEFIFRLRFKNPNDLFALAVMLFMCLSHFKLFCNVTPRYLLDSTC